MDDQVTKRPIGDKTVYLEEGWYTLDELQAYVDNVKRVEQANPRKEESNENDQENVREMGETTRWMIK
jgi:hypothetical protein